MPCAAGIPLMSIVYRLSKIWRPGTWVRSACLLSLGAFFLFCGARVAVGQVIEAGGRGPRTQRSLFVEYSNDSSHMLLGAARNRKLVTAGGSYSIRLLPSRYASLAYYGEFRPVILESDPTLKETCVDLQSIQVGTIHDCYRWISPSPVLRPWPKTYSYQVRDPQTNQLIFQETVTNTYGRRWSYAMGLSPLGYDLKILPGHRWRPVLTGLAGFLVANQDLPLQKTSNFNFTFGFGAGIEHIVAPGRAWRMEFRYHHISNDYIGSQNPGIDSGVIHVAYSFGR